MEIRRSRLLEGARGAEGAVVIIDAFRAFSVTCFAAALGARPIVAVADVDAALAIRHRRPGAILCGEAGGWPVPGFDLGNSPGELLRAAACGLDLRRRTFVQRTGAGTRGLLHARRARWLLGACLCNVSATAYLLRRLGSPVVTLVAMGRAAREPTEEDELCSQAIEAALRGEPWPAARHLARLLQTPRLQGLLSGELPPFPPSDAVLCTAVDLFDFALSVRRCGRFALIRPVRAAQAAPRRPPGGGPPPPLAEP